MLQAHEHRPRRLAHHGARELARGRAAAGRDAGADGRRRPPARGDPRAGRARARPGRPPGPARRRRAGGRVGHRGRAGGRRRRNARALSRAAASGPARRLAADGRLARGERRRRGVRRGDRRERRRAARARWRSRRGRSPRRSAAARALGGAGRAARSRRCAGRVGAWSRSGGREGREPVRPERRCGAISGGGGGAARSAGGLGRPLAALVGWRRAAVAVGGRAAPARAPRALPPGGRRAGCRDRALAIADALAGGHSLRGALGERRGGRSGPPAPSCAGCAAELELGARAPRTRSRRCAAASRSPRMDTLVAACLLQRRAGGDLARLLRRERAAPWRSATAARGRGARRHRAGALHRAARGRCCPLGGGAARRAGEPGLVSRPALEPVPDRGCWWASRVCCRWSPAGADPPAVGPGCARRVAAARGRVRRPPRGCSPAGGGAGRRGAGRAARRGRRGGRAVRARCGARRGRSLGAAAAAAPISRAERSRPPAGRRRLGAGAELMAAKVGGAARPAGRCGAGDRLPRRRRGGSASSLVAGRAPVGGFLGPDLWLERRAAERARAARPARPARRARPPARGRDRGGSRPLPGAGRGGGASRGRWPPLARMAARYARSRSACRWRDALELAARPALRSPRSGRSCAACERSRRHGAPLAEHARRPGPRRALRASPPRSRERGRARRPEDPARGRAAAGPVGAAAGGRRRWSRRCSTATRRRRSSSAPSAVDEARTRSPPSSPVGSARAGAGRHDVGASRAPRCTRKPHGDSAAPRRRSPHRSPRSPLCRAKIADPVDGDGHSTSDGKVGNRVAKWGESGLAWRSS